MPLTRWLHGLVLLALCCTPSHAFFQRLFASADHDSTSPPSSSASSRHGNPAAYPELEPANLDALSSLTDDLFSLTSPLLTQALTIGQQQLSFLSSSSHPVCSSATSTSTLHPLCLQLTDSSKMRIAIALTNCHLARARLQFYPCGEDEDPAACTAVIGRDAVAYTTYTQFYTHTDNVCLHVLRAHAQETTLAAIASLFAATINTAKQLHSFQHDTQTLSAALLASLTSNYRNLSAFLDHLAANESSHYADIRDRAQLLHTAQQQALETLHEQSEQLQGVMGDVKKVGEEVMEKQTELSDRQRVMVHLQEEQMDELGEARQQMRALHEDQRRASVAAIDALSSLLSLHHTLLAAQRESRTVLDDLTSDVSVGFTGALSSLSSLSSQQNEAFAQSQRSLSSLQEAQEGLQRLQEEMKGRVEGMREEVELLRAEEVAGFVRTGEHLQRVESQAAKAELALRHVLDTVSANVERVLALDLSMLGEMLKLSSILFYLAISAACYLVTATERTHTARLHTFLAIVTALLAERWLYHSAALTDFPRYAFLTRTALCMACGALTLLSAARYRDYATLSYAMQQRNAALLQDNHRLIQQLMLHITPPAAVPPPQYTEVEMAGWREAAEKEEVDVEEEIPFELDERQRLMTHFYTPEKGEGERRGRPRSRRSMHELGHGDAARRSGASPASGQPTAARSRSRKSRKTHSSVY